MLGISGYSLAFRRWYLAHSFASKWCLCSTFCFMEVFIMASWRIWKQRNGKNFEQINLSFDDSKTKFKDEVSLHLQSEREYVIFNQYLARLLIFFFFFCLLYMLFIYNIFITVGGSCCFRSKKKNVMVM